MKQTTILCLSVMTWVLVLGVPRAAAVGEGDPVPPDAAIDLQNTVPNTAPGDPDAGDYSIIVNAYIDSYARVTAYDSWINFGTLTQTEGTWMVPVPVIADVNAPLYSVNTVADKDLAGGAVETNCRLNWSLSFSGHLTRVDELGGPWMAMDTRKAMPGPYQLATQYKIAFHGLFIEDTVIADDEDADVITNANVYQSPTAAQYTDYNTWTDWSNTNDIAAEYGWLWPDSLGSAWTGDAYANLDGIDETAFTALDMLDLVIERGQAQKDINQGSEATEPDANRAEWWIAERVLRRGLQDIHGNYSQLINIEVTYRDDSPTVWNP